jgi:hypothetical protein
MSEFRTSCFCQRKSSEIVRCSESDVELLWADLRVRDHHIERSLSRERKA